MIYLDNAATTRPCEACVAAMTEALTKYDRYVTVSYEGKSCRVAITVTEDGGGKKEKKGCSSVLVSSSATIAMLVVGVAICAKKRED